MSNDPQLLKNEPSLKRQAVSITIITGIVIAMFFASTTITNLIAGGTRTATAEQNLADANPVAVTLNPILPVNMPPINMSNSAFRMFVNDKEYNLIQSQSDFYSQGRGGAPVRISLNFSAYGKAYAGPVVLHDELENKTIGTVTTDANGLGYALWSINSTVVAGVHCIAALISNEPVNVTAIGVIASLSLIFSSIIPNNISKSTGNLSVQMSGWLADPAYNGDRANNHVPNALIDPQLFTVPGNTSITYPFEAGPIAPVYYGDTGDTQSNPNMTFQTLLNVFVPTGNYSAYLQFVGGFYTPIVAGLMTNFTIPGMNVISSNNLSFQVNGSSTLMYRMFVNGVEYNMTNAAPIYSQGRGGAPVTISLNFSANGVPYIGPVDLYDELEGQTIGTVITDISGLGSYDWSITSALIAGVHPISARLHGAAVNYTAVGITAPLSVAFSAIAPSTVDKSTGNLSVTLSGWISDGGYTGTTWANQHVPFAQVDAQLFTVPGNFSVGSPFTPIVSNTNDTQANPTMVFQTQLNDAVPGGYYNANLHFNGTFFNPALGGNVSAKTLPMTSMSLNQSLQVIGVTPSTVNLNFLLNGSSNAVYTQIFNDGNTINASVALNIGGTPYSVATIVTFQFLDNQNGIPTSLGTATTNSNGFANLTFVVQQSYRAGPGMVHAFITYGGHQYDNYSFCILNRTMSATLSGVAPTTVDRSNNPMLSFTGGLIDSHSQGVNNAKFTAILYNMGGTQSGFTVSPQVKFTNMSGAIAWISSPVGGSDSLGSYNLTLQFDGTYDFTQHPWYALWGSLTHLSLSGIGPVLGVSTSASNKVTINIIDGAVITECSLWANNTPAAPSFTDANIGAIYNPNSWVTFNARCKTMNGYAANQRVSFADLTQNFVYTVYTDINGNATLNLQVNNSWIRGPHEITVTYYPTANPSPSANNYTVIFVNDSVQFSNVIISPGNVNRGSTSITVSGSLTNAAGIAVNKADIFLNFTTLGETGSSLNNYVSGVKNFTTGTTGAFSFSVTISTSLPQGSYKIHVEYNQHINANGFAHCPTDLTGQTKLNWVKNPSPGTVITVNATILLSSATYTPSNPDAGSSITVSGTVAWENGTALTHSDFSWINVTITDAIGTTVFHTQTILTTELSGSQLTAQVTVQNWGSFRVWWVVTPSVTPSDPYATPPAPVECSGVG